VTFVCQARSFPQFDLHAPMQVAGSQANYDSELFNQFLNESSRVAQKSLSDNRSSIDSNRIDVTAPIASTSTVHHSPSNRQNVERIVSNSSHSNAINQSMVNRPEHPIESVEMSSQLPLFSPDSQPRHDPPENEVLVEGARSDNTNESDARPSSSPLRSVIRDAIVPSLEIADHNDSNHNRHHANVQLSQSAAELSSSNELSNAHLPSPLELPLLQASPSTAFNVPHPSHSDTDTFTANNVTSDTAKMNPSPPPQQQPPPPPPHPTGGSRAVQQALQHRAKMVTFCVNGQPFRPQIRIAMLMKEFPQLSYLLDHLTDRLGMAVRYMFDLSGHRINSLSQLQHNCAYVVSGSARFQPANYARFGQLGSTGLAGSHFNLSKEIVLFTEIADSAHV
jgi:hypothetical protein